MAIPEAQLETWSHQGAIQGSSTTYNAVKSVLEAKSTPYADRNYQIFLQGSYGNDTNIYAESDVDVVILMKDCFYSDLEALSDAEKEAWKSVHSDATYTYTTFKKDVLSVLTAAYGKDVEAGDKAIMIDASSSRRKTDVIASMQFRRYYKFNGFQDQSYEEGICFFNSAGERIANYPKQHSANLTKMHQDSSNWLKPMVRIWKNMRTKLVNDGVIKAGLAPSYYIEGLLYNVPAEKFGGSYADSFVNVFNWIQKEADKSKLVCANEQYYLLRDNAHTCWSQANCNEFLEAAAQLWKGWGS
ncbi:nucleotidyltransferase [Pseudomonas alliivorans]|jgi:hypothetical protein|nr:nucleotidyltransferase [Pseudomonas alliivorans]MEE4801059.1 nucleotidyltransferase [Pseudomonas alliivorans]MEE4947031.1 nucleotidyltransferase [Pseudomonas alliivorans]